LIAGGRILRAAGIDELPQIINVILGDMSLVGPRPCTTREMPSFQSGYEERFDAPPGLTGYWQVNGKNQTTFTRMMELDIYYARRMSLGLDLAIIARTFPLLLGLVRETLARSAAAKAAERAAKRPPAPRISAAAVLDATGGAAE
jgi:lipopolysaccharide/colanic/teichoic acid biosynthesis glycosyltransferase